MIMNKVLCFAVLVFIFAGCKDKREECIDLPPVSTPLVFTITNIQGAATLDVRGTLKAFRDGGAGSHKAGILFAEFFDANGKSCGSGNLNYSAFYKCGYRYLAANARSSPFCVRIAVPSSADSAQLKVATFVKGWSLGLSEFTYDIVQHPPPPAKFQMKIVSLWFLLFIAGLFVLYFCLPFFQPYVLLFASCAFYAFFGWLPFAFIGSSALSIWAGGLWIERAKRHKEWLLGLVVVFNVGILVLLKYIHPWTSIVVPLGISFYSLQAISYVWDVKRGTIPAERNPLKLSLYLIFFPTVMQGPISRYGQLGAQLWDKHSYSWDRMQSGLELALWGFFKKMVIADRNANSC